MNKSTAKIGRLVSIALTICAAALLAAPAGAQMATGKSKFVGSAADNPQSNFSTYFNQVTPENATKWGTVESTRNVR